MGKPIKKQTKLREKKQAKREAKKLVKRQRIYPVIAAIAIQFTLGTAYIWSVFQTGVANSIFLGEDGGANAAAGLTFSLLLALLTLGSVIGGKLAVRFNTRIVVFAGGLILSTGFFLSSFVTPGYGWVLWVTYGVMGGIGMGFTYSTTIACAQKWFPHKKGLISGIIVASLGLGGVAFTPLVEHMIVAFGGGVEGAGELISFRVLSLIFLMVCSIGSLFLKNPPDGYMSDVMSVKTAAASETKNYTTAEMLKTPRFYLILITFMLACMGGQMMMGFAKPIANAKDLAAVAAIAVLSITLMNSVGRLFWGMISDKLGRTNTVLVLLSGATVLPLFVNAVTGYWVFALIALFGFFYGGVIGTFPSLTADLFGAKHMATNYGCVLLGFGAGAIISMQVGGYFMDVVKESNDINRIFPAFIIASCCAVIGIVLMLVLKRMQRTKKEL